VHEAGIRHYRLEFLDETPDELTSAVTAYQNLFARRLSADDVWTSLKAMNRVGITTGTLEERRNPLAIL
jgi:putative protease